MHYRQLGHTGLKVSLIGLGTMTFGEQNTEAEGHAQIDRALDCGVNLLDTSEMYAVPARAETYGATERIIGSWIRQRGGRDSGCRPLETNLASIEVRLTDDVIQAIEAVHRAQPNPCP